MSLDSLLEFLGFPCQKTAMDPEELKFDLKHEATFSSTFSKQGCRTRMVIVPSFRKKVGCFTISEENGLRGGSSVSISVNMGLKLRELHHAYTAP
jgi:hypothetical protein